MYLIPHSGLTKSGNEKHWTSFFQNTEHTYHCIIMHIFKKRKQKQSIIKLNKQSINLTWYAMWIDFRNKNMFRSCIMKIKWTNSNVATSPIFDGLFHVIKSLIIFIASFVRGYIMMLKLHEWSKNVIFKCKNYVPHLLFHLQIVVFRNSFFRHLSKALII